MSESQTWVTLHEDGSVEIHRPLLLSREQIEQALVRDGCDEASARAFVDSLERENDE